LVRAYKAPNNENKKPLSIEDHRHLSEEELQEKRIIRMPDDIYGKMVYNNVSSFTTREEMYLYKFKHKRYNPLMNLVIGYIFSRKGIVASKNEETSKIVSLLDNLFGKPSLFKAKLPKKF
jgi:hypothetical protein